MSDNIKKDFKRLLVILAVATIAAIIAKEVFLVIVVIAASLILGGGGHEFTYLQIWALNAVISYTPPIAVYWFAFRKIGFKPTEPANFKYALLPAFFLSLYSLAVISNLVSHFIAGVIGFKLPDPFENFLPSSSYEWAIMLVFVGIVAAVAEEIIYRKLLLQPLRKFGDAQAIVISAVLFAALHGNFTQFLYALTGGLILGVVTVRANSLVPAIILHAANNIFVMLMLYADETTRLDTGMFIPILVIVGVFMTVVLFRYGQFAASNDCAENSELSSKERLRIIATNPAVIILLIALIVNMVRGSLSN